MIRIALAVALVACAKERREVATPPPAPPQVQLHDAAVVIVDASGECPAQEPADSAACTGTAACTYGASPDCATIYLCFDGNWRQVGHGTCGAKCPATASSEALPPQGIVVKQPLTCVYPSGVVCGYAPEARPCSGVPSPPPLMRWTCASPSRCQLVKPGTRCSSEGEQCGGACCNSGYRCTKGTWQTFSTPCPP
jgi:hypothetical protein